LTEQGEHTDAFALQYIAGRDTIKTTMIEAVAGSSGKTAGTVCCKQHIQKGIHQKLRESLKL
jgi:hypothetical protein